MPSRDNTSKIKTVNVLDKSTRTATAASASVDTQGYDAVSFHLYTGAPGDTLASNVTIEWDVQDSPDGNTWSPVPDALINVQFSASNPQGVAVGTANGAANTGCALFANANSVLGSGLTLRFGYVGIQRYVRVNEVHAGTQSVGTSSQIIAVLSEPTYNPIEGSLS